MKFINIIYAFLLAVLIYIIWNYKLVTYGIGQLKGQLHIIYNAQPLQQALNDNAYSIEQKNNIKLIQQIREYAVKVIGLKDSKNYTTVYNQHDKPVLWVLTACKPFSMEAYEWHFPFLGDVSYKGFFEKEKGEKEVERLKNQFYDVDYSPTSAWSTLGWFRDPVLSNMLHKSKGRLAELIIHELTHATVYLPGKVDYNENLATFVGEEGAIRFMKDIYGDTSAILQQYIYTKEDEEVFGNYMVNACKRLDSLYQTFSNESFKAKLKLKYVLITDIIINIKLLNLHYPDRYKFVFPGPLPGNAWFMAFKRYRGKQTEFKNKLRMLNGNLQLFVEQIK
jgi:predicted aminopeptidase